MQSLDMMKKIMDMTLVLKGKSCYTLQILNLQLYIQIIEEISFKKILIEKLEELAKADNIKYICATAAPDNKYSSDNIKELGFEIVCEKEKYGGLRRYVFMKRI